ncbi:MAG TPA: DJ-1/PfpI family protein [Polyangiales bacterium]
MDIVCLIFDGITALDAIGPYEVLSRMPGAKLRFVAPRAEPVRTDSKVVCWTPESSIDEVERCDVLLVPGGVGARRLQFDERVLGWLREVDATTKLTATVCTGSILLAASGMLRGRRATSHWAFLDELRPYGAEPVSERVVRDGKYASAAGVSAGIDLALTLALELCGRQTAEAIQLSIEYDPAPPLDAGSPGKVAPALRDALYRRNHADDAELAALRSQPSRR